MILTFRRYVDAERRRCSAEYGVPLAEVARLYPDEHYRREWWEYVLDFFESGEDFSVQGLRTLNKAQFRDLSRTTRGLRQGLPLPYLLASARLFS